MTGADHRVSNIDFTRTQLSVLMVTILLSIDTINPVKIVLHVFPAVAAWHIVALCLILSLYIWISEFKELLYYSVKIFFHSILSIFFRDVETIGRDKIPRHGPIIFTVNHANQFIDAVSLLTTCQHKVSYLMAEASWKRRIIGDIAWALDVVPVKRAQDDAKRGTGQIIKFVYASDYNNSEKTGSGTSEPSEATNPNNKLITVIGHDTKFTAEVNKGDKIRPNGTPIGVKIVEIVDDTCLLVDGESIDFDDEESSKPFRIGSNIHNNSSGSSDSKGKEEDQVTYDILKRVDQKVVYAKVLDKLAQGGCVGIFPEGGSHDRTDLLPLKVGVALIAYSALEKDGLNVPIVPVGLNYFQAHRWRGRAVVEYGEPIYIDPNTLSSYKAGGIEKRSVCNELLDRIQDSMKSVIVSTPDYETLQLIHTARRLYQRNGLRGKEKQDLARRFAAGYNRLLMIAEGDPPERWLDLQRRVVAYQRELRELGIRDYQVPGLDRDKTDIHLEDIDGDLVLKEMRVPYQIVHLLILLFLAAIPTLLLNLPVGVLAGIYAEKRRKKALARSKVKIRGFDVMLTEKVMFCIVAIPTMWFIYGLVLYIMNFDGPTITLAIISLPVFSYTGIIVSEAGMVELKDLRPYLMRLFPSSRRRLAALPAVRRELQVDLRAFIKRLGPALGEIYYGKDLNWKEIQEKSRLSSQKRLSDLAGSSDDVNKKDK